MAKYLHIHNVKLFTISLYSLNSIRGNAKTGHGNCFYNQVIINYGWNIYI